MPTILLVEDNEHNWDMLSRRLKRRDYEVVLAVDGQQGIDKAAQLKPDLILMDVDLPVKDGLSATREIRATPNGKEVPIIALTAHAMSGDRDKALEAGCSDYHAKPVEFNRLIAQIESALSEVKSEE